MDGNNRQFSQQTPQQGYNPYAQQAQGQPAPQQQFQGQPQSAPVNPYYQQGYNSYTQQVPQQGYNPYTQQVPKQGYNPYMQQPGQGYDPFALPGMNNMQPAFDKKSARKHFSGVGMSYFLFSIVAAVFQIIVSVIVDAINPDLWDNYLFMITASLLPMYLIGAPVCYLLMKRLPSEKPEKAPWGFGKFVAGLIIAFGLMYIGSFIGTYIGLLIESFAPEAQASTNTVQELVFSGDMMVNIAFMVFIGPVVEELLFRKLLCDRLRIYGEGITVAVTGLLFGLFHGNLTQFVYAAMLGCLLAYVYLKTGRVTITIAYHVIINFFGSVVPLLALNATDIEGFDEIMASGDNELIMEFISDNVESFAIYALYAMSIFGFMIVGLILLIVFAATGKIKFRPGRYTIPSGKKFAVVIINAGMILFILVEIGEILLNMFV